MRRARTREQWAGREWAEGGGGVQDSKVVGIRNPNPNQKNRLSVCYRKNNLLIVVFMLRSDINIL